MGHTSDMPQTKDMERWEGVEVKAKSYQAKVTHTHKGLCLYSQQQGSGGESIKYFKMLMFNFMMKI